MIPKFRAWEQFAKEMLTPSMGAETTIGMVSGELFILRHGYKEVILMQSTGLHDKNGVEIYEGDIASVIRWDSDLIERERKCTVVYHNGSWCLNTKDGHFTTLHWATTCYNTLVIGNIHEHPHLLE